MIKQISIFFIAFLWAGWSLAQVPQSFKYQAVARDAINKPYANTPIKVRVILKEKGLGGTPYYEEDHSITTSDLGIFNLNVGQGTPYSGSFSAVPWQSKEIYLRIDLSFDGGFSWVVMGESPLLSVPYALYAGAVPLAGAIADADGDTRVETEKNPDEDIIRFSLAGEEKMILRQNMTGTPRLELKDTLFNQAVGESSLSQNTIGYNNTAFGYNTLRDNISGIWNCAFGTDALSRNAYALGNTAMGNEAMFSNFGSPFDVEVGCCNSALGDRALRNNYTGASNTAVGQAALYNNYDGYFNCAIGIGVLEYNGSGWGNTGVGSFSLSGYLYGNYNTALGYGAYVSVDSLTNATAIGNGASVNESNKVRIGNSAVGVIEGNVMFTPSDGRFKSGVRSEAPGLDFIRRLDAVTYHFNYTAYSKFLGEKNVDYDVLRRKEQQLEMGFVAQDVEKAMRESGLEVSNLLHVPDNERGNYSIAYGQLVVPLVKAVQEQQAQIEVLQKENAELKAQMSDLRQLKAEVEALKRRIER